MSANTFVLDTGRGRFTRPAPHSLPDIKFFGSNGAAVVARNAAEAERASAKCSVPKGVTVRKPAAAMAPPSAVFTDPSSSSTVPPGHTDFSWLQPSVEHRRGVPPGHTEFTWCDGGGDVGGSGMRAVVGATVVVDTGRGKFSRPAPGTLPDAKFFGNAPSSVTSSSSSSAASSSASPAASDTPTFMPPAVADGEDDHTTYLALIAKLHAAGVSFRHLGPHEHTPTSAEAAALRVKLGWTEVTLASGAKAMLVVNSKNVARPYCLAVMAADRQLDWKKMKKLIPKGKSARMATEAEVLEVTGCRPGGVPPFGSLFTARGGVQTFVDASLQEQGRVCNFNAGLRTRSMQITVTDYLAVEAPELVRITSDKPPAAAAVPDE